MTSWYLLLYPRGEITDSENHVSLYLNLCDVDDFNLKIDLEIFLLDRKKGKVEIQRFSSDVIQNMLHFMYTGSLSTPLGETEAADLLGAADQYQLDLLKRVCENKLCELLNVDNCLRLLAIADMHQAVQLKALGMKLVIKNMNTIVIKNSEDWKKCVKSHPDLAVEITEEQAKRNGV